MYDDYEDEFTDLVAVLALGALPEAEARRTAAHLATCDRCRALYAELRPAANFVGYSEEADAKLDEVTSARMKGRLMRAVRGEESAAPVRRRPSFGWLAAVAAAILAAVIGADDIAVRDGARRASVAERNALSAQQAQVAALQSESRVTQARLVSILGPGGKHFAVPQGEVVTNDRHVLIALQLAALPQGKVYQAWTLAKGAKAVTPSVTFSPAASGVAIVELPVDATGLVAVAVSVEPAGGSRAPTSTPKFIRKLS
jgi:hypothetical protein